MSKQQPGEQGDLFSCGAEDTDNSFLCSVWKHLSQPACSSGLVTARAVCLGRCGCVKDVGRKWSECDMIPLFVEL